MAKELPYFQFEPAEWMMGRIQRCRPETKAAFIDLCCRYWNAETEMTLEDAELDCGEDEVQEMLKKKVITSDEGMISISFLNDQYDNILEMKEKRKKAADARWSKKQSKPDASAMQVHKDAMQNDADKIREDKSKEDKRKEKEKKSNTITVPNVSALSNKLKTIFLKTYLHETGNEFYWGPKEATNLRQLIAKISFSIKEKKEKDSAQKEKEPTQEEIVSSFEIILKNLPQWNRENNYSISGINSQYNKILNSIKNGKSEQSTANSLQNLFDRVDQDFGGR